MTGYTVHTGSNDKFSSGWDRVFSNPPKAKTAAKKTPAGTAKKAAVKKKKAAK